ncbi:MAG: hypothetical protein NTY90_00505, partial [Candidatus Micrarchaeota archaeon]|nr:hypothetical protein [Candidatus Micrarchaeota archaeon]
TAFIWHGKEIAAQWKKIALAAIAFIALCIPLFAYNYTSTGSPVGLLSTYFSSALSYGQAMGTPFEQYFLLLPAVFSTQWTILLIAIATVWGLWKKNRALITLAAALFITLLILSAATGWKEDRYILFLLPPGLLLASFAIVSSVKAALKTISEKKDEFLIEAALAVIALFALASGTVLNYGNAAALVTAKIPSYGALQPAGEFIQTITAPGETIVSNSGHELAYYAQRKVLTIGSTIDGFKQDLAKNNATVIAFTVYEQQSTVMPALQKFQDKTLVTPTNPYEYVLAGVNTGEFQIVKAVNENIGGQESTSVVIFKKMR